MNNQKNVMRLTSGKLNPVNDQDIFAMPFELQKPMNNIQLSIDMFRTVIVKGDQEVYLDVIERNVSRIETFVRQCLSNMPQVVNAPTENTFRELLNEVLEIAGELISSRAILIIREDAVSYGKTLLNKPAIKIALIHIVTNAIAIVDQVEGKLRLKTEIIDNKFTLNIEVNGHATIRPVSRVLTTAVYLLRTNYINLVVNEEPGKTSFMLTFDCTPE